MGDRKQEKFGWIGGWLGGFIWVLILSIMFFIQDKHVQAWIGMSITCGAFAVILFFSPWRYPHVKYRLLMAPIYVLFFVAIAWGVWTLGDLRQMGINSWWATLILLPILTPFWTVGKRRWDHHDT